MTGTGFAAVFAWIVTYALHSTLLLLAAWLVSRLFGRRRIGLQEAVWRLALLLGLLTATLQLVSGIEPLGGAVSLQPEPCLARGTPAAPRFPGLQPTGSPPAPVIQQNRGATLVVPWRQLLLLLWLAGGVTALVRLLGSWYRLCRLLRDRRPLPAGRVARRLAAAIGAPPAVRLSISTAIDSPLATGLWRPEVCLPAHAVAAIPAEQCNGLLAHELAHLARRDPAWLLLYRLLAGIFFFQLLNHLACRHLEETAECLSDDLAVCRTGNRLGLARSLVHFADQAASRSAAPGQPVGMAAAVSLRSNLAWRIERILLGETNGSISMKALLPLAFLALLIGTVTLPAASWHTPATAEETAAPDPAVAPQDSAPAPGPDPAPTPDLAPADPPAAPPAPDPPPRQTPEPAAAAPPPSRPDRPDRPDEPDRERFQRLAERMARKAERLADLELDLSGISEEMELRLEERMAEIEERVRRHAERLHVDERVMRELEEHALEIVEQVKPSEEEIHRLAESARRVAEEISLEELEELEEAARELAEEAEERARYLLRFEERQRDEEREQARAEAARRQREEAESGGLQ